MLRAWLRPDAAIAWATIGLCLLLIAFPTEALHSSARGLAVWWEVLFPALFPFFVLSEILLGFGIVHFLGTLLDPFMRPLFRIPGSGGFVVAMGYVSGYPVGARLTAKLREQNLVTRTEGERLVAFTTTSDPIFLIGAVSIGFFHRVDLAPILAVSHYGSGLLVGLLMRYHGRKEPMSESPTQTQQRGSRLVQALQAMHKARLQDGRPFGRLLQESVHSALRLMIVVGGLVVFFSTTMEMLRQSGAIHALTDLLQLMFGLIGLPKPLTDAVVFGLFEVTLGSRSAGEAGGVLMHQAAIAAWVLSWAGLSVHAQVASILSSTGLRYRPFVLARLIHSLLAALFVYALWGILGPH
ncbi:sporulation integral membrane protein YlbJ [Paenibacillus cellulosilyticus]|uniref:Sporulation integral membrane protein YlbJ n=1 Tax=Paenibacillus cellulosilyticus TaxID=375489 RepID=A0A2V2YTG9_9BACL|nr:sporulation integral membrane protein YlbJ [Paenibacillus cellulosilyticus]PWW02549.1 sporulation integral membrane protein YlbJ [Paenibacillus cellulosilyticus]QKS47244.1 sporulation integral membrane protein YlbJ [Paenibacillus cellulosilyticus]